MTPENKKKRGTHLAQKPISPKKQKKQRTRDEIIRRRVTILAVVAAVMLLLAIALRLWIREPNLPNLPSGGGDAAAPGGATQSTDRKDGVYTFLLLGRDTGGGGNTDTLMVVTYDTKAQSVNVLNIYRDTMVNAPWDIKRINSVYNANKGGEAGIEALKTYLKELIGFAPDYYVTVEWDAVGEMVDAIGGVEFDVPYEMHYYDPTQNLRINQAKGLRTLNGSDAMQVIRWRKNNDGSKVSVGDIGRVEIQQNFIQAVAQKCLKTINLNTVPKFAKILTENVTTDIPMGTMVWFGQHLLGMNMENLTFHSLPGNLNGSAWSRSYHNYQSYVLPDGPAIVELINASFNPYKEDVKLTDLDIMSVNKNGTLSSSTGVVRDTKATAAPVIPSKAPVEPDDGAEITNPGETEPSPSPIPSDVPPSTSGGDVTDTPGAVPTEEAPPEFQPSQPPEATPTDVPPVTPTPIPTSTTETAPEFLPPVPTPAA